MISTSPCPAAISLPASPRRWELAGTILLIALSCWVFFYRLGSEDLHDWDEAWHAQVSSEILSTGRWLPLSDRGVPYFNKPPLTFWLRAIAFRIGGINEVTSRFFPALFGLASVLLAAHFFRQVCGRTEGLLAGYVLCTSWLFALHHAGRSGETDSTLIFFQIATAASLWKARNTPAWFYIGGICTALGWMTKGSTAYLIWPVIALAEGLHRLSTRHHTQIAPPPFRPVHAIGGLLLAFALTLPWQLLMLAQYGRAFATAFYLGEGLLPAMHVIENHPGNPMFYIWVFHVFFQPWLLLATGTIGWLILQKGGDERPAVYLFISWATVIAGACTLFATKMDWYATPALPPLAALAAIAGCELCRRRWGWLLLLATSTLGTFQIVQQSWSLWGLALGLAIAILIAIVLKNDIAPSEKWRNRLAAVILVVPLVANFNLNYRVIVRGDVIAEWTALHVDDEPWGLVCRRIDRDFAGHPILLVDIPLNPAAYFYLHHLKQRVLVESIAPEQLPACIAINPESLVITRAEYSPPLKAEQLIVLFSQSALLVERVTP